MQCLTVKCDKCGLTITINGIEPKDLASVAERFETTEGGHDLCKDCLGKYKAYMLIKSNGFFESAN